MPPWLTISGKQACYGRPQTDKALHRHVVIYFVVLVSRLTVSVLPSRLVLMSLHVQGKMVRATESTVTVSAFEGFRSRVLSEVSGEFVRSSEFPRAAFPRAFVGFLARVRSDVRFEVRAFRVDFGAAEILASMYSPLLNIWVLSS